MKEVGIFGTIITIGLCPLLLMCNFESTGTEFDTRSLLHFMCSCAISTFLIITFKEIMLGIGASFMIGIMKECSDEFFSLGDILCNSAGIIIPIAIAIIAIKKPRFIRRLFRKKNSRRIKYTYIRSTM